MYANNILILIIPSIRLSINSVSYTHLPANKSKYKCNGTGITNWPIGIETPGISVDNHPKNLYSNAIITAPPSIFPNGRKLNDIGFATSPITVSYTHLKLYMYNFIILILYQNSKYHHLLNSYSMWTI